MYVHVHTHTDHVNFFLAFFCPGFFLSTILGSLISKPSNRRRKRRRKRRRRRKRKKRRRRKRRRRKRRKGRMGRGEG